MSKKILGLNFELQSAAINLGMLLAARWKEYNEGEWTPLEYHNLVLEIVQRHERIVGKLLDKYRVSKPNLNKASR